MLLIYQRGGNVAKSKFDMSLLKPVNERNADFESQLKPLEEEDEGAYLDSLPEGDSFLHKLPRNILIGLTHAGRNLHNLPHDVSKLAEWPIEKLAGPLKHPLSSYLPNDEQDYSDVFGGNKNENTLMDSLIQGGIEHAPELIGAGGLIKSGLRKLPITQKGAARQLKEAEKLIEQRGINNFQTNYPLLQEASQFLPKTHASGEMLQGVINGEYKPAFALQSQIGKHARDLAKSPLASERLLAPQARELKGVILHEMEQALRSTGHHKEADLLKGGIEDYAKYMKFREKALPVLKKLGIPTTGLALLGLGTNKGKRIATKLLE
jgi:hypothetical protein